MTFRSFRSLLMFALAQVTAGCETTEPRGAGADGGAGGDVGAATDSGGQTDAGDAVKVQVPSCLQALFANCPTEGACQSNSTNGARPTRYCFANGVRADYTHLGGGCAGDGRSVLEVRNPNGGLCYTTEFAQGTLCESEEFKWRDASGQLIATGSKDAPNEIMLKCADGSEPTTCTDVVQCRLGSWWGSVDCQPGCP